MVSKVSSKKHREWFIYMIETKSGRFYTGVTTDHERRFKEHQSSKRGAKFFRSDPAQGLVYLEKVNNRSHALKREHEIKKLTHEQKRVLIGRFHENRDKLN